MMPWHYKATAKGISHLTKSVQELFWNLWNIFIFVYRLMRDKAKEKNLRQVQNLFKILWVSDALLIPFLASDHQTQGTCSFISLQSSQYFIHEFGCVYVVIDVQWDVSTGNPQNGVLLVSGFCSMVCKLLNQNEFIPCFHKSLKFNLRD